MVRNRYTGDTAIAYNDGTGLLTWNGNLISGLTGLGASDDAKYSAYVGHFGGTEADDLMLRRADTGEMVVAISSISCSSTTPAGAQLAGFAQGVAWTPLIGDFDNSSRDDLMLLNRDTGHVAIALNNGTGGFLGNSGWASELTGIGASQDWQPYVGNFASDARDDLMVRNRNTGQVVVLANQTSGWSCIDTTQFSPGTTEYPISFGVGQVWTPLIGDFDG